MTASPAPSVDGFGAEIERCDPAVGKAQRAQLVVEPHLDVALLEMLHRRLDEGGAEPVACDQRPARLAARAKVSRTTADASAAEPCRGSMFSAASSSGCTSR